MCTYTTRHARFALLAARLTPIPRKRLFFQFYLLAGRPPEQKIALLQDFTSLLASELGAPAELIRGFCTHVPPQDWGIAGVPAALEREDEIAAREIGK